MIYYLKTTFTFLMKKSRNICRICLAVRDLSMMSSSSSGDALKMYQGSG